jgi:AcrR family transcriptional regulator
MVRLNREESRARTRELLLASAGRAFARAGYGGASVDDIAEDAGFSKGAFYSNFASKEAVFLVLLEAHKLQEIAAARSMLELDLDAETLTGALADWLDRLNADADWSLLAIELELNARRSESFAVEYDALQARFDAATVDIVVRIFERLGLVPPAPAEDIAAAFVALSHGTALQKPDDARRPGRLARMFFELIAKASEPREG